MSRRKPTSIEKAAAAAGAAAARQMQGQDLELEDPEMDALDALMSQLGPDSAARVVIECIRPVDRAGRLETVSPEQIADIAQYITDEYGPGKYKVYAIDERNRFLPGRHATIEVSPMARRNGVRAQANPPGGAPVQQPGAPTDIVREIEARNEKMRLEAREDRKFLLELLAPLGTALISGLFARQPSLVDQAAALQALRPPGGSDAEKLIGMFKQGMEIASGMGGEGEGWPGVIKEGLKLGGEFVRGLPPPTAQPPPPARIPLAPAHPQPTAQPQETRTMSTVKLPEDMEFFEPILRKMAHALVGFAEAKAETDTAATAIAAMVPAPVRRLVTPLQVVEWLETPTWWEFTEGFEPRLAGHQAYCDGVRQALLGAFRALVSPPKGAQTGEPA